MIIEYYMMQSLSYAKENPFFFFNDLSQSVYWLRSNYSRWVGVNIWIDDDQGKLLANKFSCSIGKALHYKHLLAYPGQSMIHY